MEDGVGMIDAVYIFDAARNVTDVIINDVYELIHAEDANELTAEIGRGHAIEPGMYLGFTGIDGRFLLFGVDSVEKEDRNGLMTITAIDAGVYELAHSIAPTVRLTGKGARDIISALIDGSGFVLGTVDAGKRKADCGAYMDYRWTRLKEAGAALNVRVIPFFEFEYTKITAKKIDVIKKGAKTPIARLYEGETDTSSIVVSRSGPPVGRMYGIGKATGTEDPPECVTFADVVWKKSSGDPANKPKGQTYIEDAEIAAGQNPVIEERYEDRYCEDPEQLLTQTWEELQRRRAPTVKGTATAADMEHIPGYEHKKARMYDRVLVRTAHGEDVEATIIGIKRNYMHPAQTKISLGEETEEEQRKKTLSQQIASLSSESKSSRRGGAASANRQSVFAQELIQLDADVIQLNSLYTEINAEVVKINSEVVDIDGRLEALAGKFDSLISGETFIEKLSATSIECSNLTWKRVLISPGSFTPVVGGRVTITGHAYEDVYDANANKIGYVNVPTNISFTPSYGSEIYYMNWGGEGIEN